MQNREIKFRAWDSTTSNPKMILWEQLKSFKVEDVFILSQDVIVMQYTGMKDKNGKEIYEGDVVRRIAQKIDFDRFYKKEIPSATYDEVQISFIEYRGNGFWVKDEDFGYEGEDMWDWELMEVIGNIYENPELLNKKS